MAIPTDPGDFSNGTNADATAVNNRFHALFNAFTNLFDASNMAPAFAKDNVEPAFSGYKTLVERAAELTATNSGTYIFGDDAFGLASLVPWAETAFYFDPADWVAGSRATKLRLRAQLATNANAPAVNFTFGLYPIATVTGGAAVPKVNSLGSVVAGSTVAINTPAANSQNQSNSGDFTVPAVGFYCIAVVVSGAPAANAAEGIRAELQMRQV